MLMPKSQVGIKILNYYFLNPKAGVYVNELARILELDPKNTHRKLEELERQGLLASQFSGKQRYFSLAKNQLAKNYRQLFLQTAGLENQLRQALKGIKGLSRAYIYGSYAKNAMDAASDVDILAIGEHSVLALEKAVQPIQKYSGRAINIRHLTSHELEQKKTQGNNFIKEVFKNELIKIK